MLVIKKRDFQQEQISRLDGDVDLLKDLDSKDKIIEGYIRNGTQNHKGISLSQELALHRKKICGVVNEEEWNDYVLFVQECIAKANEEL